jgi:hypothetical protein
MPLICATISAHVVLAGRLTRQARSEAGTGLFGKLKYAANFTADSPTQRLKADRSAVPALTSDIGGPNAVVSMVAWVRRPGMSVHHGVHSDGFYGFLAGVWGDFPLGPEKLEARQYALFFDLGACNFFEGKGAVKGTPKCVVVHGSGGCLYHVHHFQFAQEPFNASLVTQPLSVILTRQKNWRQPCRPCEATGSRLCHRFLLERSPVFETALSLALPQVQSWVCGAHLQLRWCDSGLPVRDDCGVRSSPTREG